MGFRVFDLGKIEIIFIRYKLELELELELELHSGFAGMMMIEREKEGGFGKWVLVG